MTVPSTTPSPEEPNKDFLKKNDEPVHPAEPQNSAPVNSPYAAPPQPSQPPHADPNGYQYPTGAGSYPQAGQAPVNNAYPQGQQQGMYHNPAGYVPQEDMWTNAKKPQNLSLIYGVSSLVVMFILTFFFAPLAIASPVLAIMGILEAKKAERVGIDATPGKIVSWIALILSIIGVVVVMILIFGFFALLAAGSMSP